MKKIISLLLVLLLALTSAFAVNAEGIKDIFGAKAESTAPRGLPIPTGGLSNQTYGSLTWSLTEAGELNIRPTSGSVQMPNDMTSTTAWRNYSDSITTVVIESGVTRIGANAFADCGSLLSVTVLEDSSMVLADRAFSGCTNLTSITLSRNITYLSFGSYVFQNCASLRSITIPANPYEVNGNAFSGCNSLQSICFLGNPSNVKYMPSSVVIVGKSGSSVETHCNSNHPERFKVLGSNYQIALDLNANDAQLPSGVSATLNKTAGTNATLPVPTRSGYTFAGWTRNSSATLSSIDYYDCLDADILADTLYAVWVDKIVDLSPSAGNEFVGDNNPLTPTYEDSKLGEENGDSKTWIKQSAKWDYEGQTATLRLDYAYAPETKYTSRDVIFVLDVSDSMGGTSITTMINTVISMTADILESGLNNRIAYTAFGSNLASSRNFSNDAVASIRYLNTLNTSGDTNYSAGLAKAYSILNSRTDASREPMLIFFTDGAPSAGNKDGNNIYGGTEASAIKAAGCKISSVYLGNDYTSNQTVYNITTSPKAQLEAISSNENMVYNCSDASGLASAISSAFYVVANRDYNLKVNLDTGRFTTTNNATIGGSYGNSTVEINNNVITWDVASLADSTQYYITVPLTFNQNASPLSQTPNGAHGAAAGYYPTSLEGENTIATLYSTGESQAVINTVRTPVLYLSDSPQPPETHYIRYYDGSTLLQEEEMSGTTHTLTAAPITTPEAGVTGIEDGIPTKAGYLFAGWYTTAQTPGTTSGVMFPQSITIADYDDANGDLNLYAGWVAKGTVTVDNSDPNKSAYGANSLSGFNLEGIQIKSKAIADEGVDRAEWQNAQYDGLRFITVYRNGLINELDGLYVSGNPNYKSADDTAITYGYTMYAKADIANLQTLKANTTGAKDIDCTRDTNMNHKYFTNYRLSTIVIKYEGTDQQYVDAPIEARAYIDYIDANGFARRGYDTYGDVAGETSFAGGCRASFSQARAALSRPAAQ